MPRFATEFHALPVREGQVGSVPGAALPLTVATLAVVHDHRFAGDFITDRAAGASAGIGLAHVFSPASVLLRAWDDPGSEKESINAMRSGRIAPAFGATTKNPDQRP